VDKWAVIFRPLIHNLLTERSVFDQLLLNQSTLNFEISCPKPLTHSVCRNGRLFIALPQNKIASTSAPTLKEAIFWIAQLGGFLGRNRMADPDP